MRRRDPRYPFPSGAGFVEFEVDGQRYWAELTEVSVAGLSFEMDSGLGLKVGASMRDVIVHVGECDIEGELSVNHTQVGDQSRHVVGCLFYPASQLGEKKWSAVVASRLAGGGD